MINDDDERRLSTGTTGTTDGVPKRRGFATMDPKLVSELAQRGGKAAHVAGTAHQFTSEEARIAGRKGGMATHAKRSPSTKQS
jgi:general stress protein YciG